MTLVYRVFSYFGLLSISGAPVRVSLRSGRAVAELRLQRVLYGAWVTVHLLMTTGAFKRAGVRHAGSDRRSSGRCTSALRSLPG